jgi:hypothetical protein
MKKARIAFTAIAIFGIVGGALAFKAQRTFKILYVPAVAGADEPCTIPVNTRASIVASGGAAAFFSTTVALDGCPTLTIQGL